MWTRNSDVSNWNMLKHFIYSSSSKSTTSFLCSIYYRYSSKLSSFFCILSFLVRAISIDQKFYSATHYLAAVWLDSRHDFNIFCWLMKFLIILQTSSDLSSLTSRTRSTNFAYKKKTNERWHFVWDLTYMSILWCSLISSMHRLSFRFI